MVFCIFLYIYAKMTQAGRRWPKKAPRGSTMAPRRPKMATRWPKLGPRSPQAGPRWRPAAPRRPPRGLQDGSELFEDAPGGPQEGPKTVPRWAKTLTANFAILGPFAADAPDAAGWPQMAPRWAKTVPRWPQDAPRRPQEGFRRASRGPQDGSKCARRRQDSPV